MAMGEEAGYPRLVDGRRAVGVVLAPTPPSPSRTITPRRPHTGRHTGGCVSIQPPSTKNVLPVQ